MLFDRGCSPCKGQTSPDTVFLGTADGLPEEPQGQEDAGAELTGSGATTPTPGASPPASGAVLGAAPTGQQPSRWPLCQIGQTLIN